MNGIFFAVLGAVLILGCSRLGRGPSYETGSASSETVAQLPPSRVRAIPSDQHYSPAQTAFLKSLRAADPRRETIEQAVMNGDDSLGIVLARNIDLDDVPPLMQILLKQMAVLFPGKDLTIVAFGAANPPVQVGVALLDSASHQMIYIPAAESEEPAALNRKYLVRC